MCSDCGDESEESDHPQVDTEAPRSLRGRENLKRPNKYRGGASPLTSNHLSVPKTPKGPSTPKSDKDSNSTPAAPNKKSTDINNSLPLDNNVNNFNEGKCDTCSRDDYKKNLVQ